MLSYLQQHCSFCKGVAVDEELRGIARGEWFRMVRQPLEAHKWGCKDRVSLMLMFHLTLLNLRSESLQERFLEPSQDFYLDALAVFRHWCKTVAFGMNTDEDPQALTRLLAVIEDVYGRFIHQEVQALVELYHRQRHQLLIRSWDMTQVWPTTETDLSVAFMDAVDRLRTFSLVNREYPVDFTTAIDDVCDAASAWSASLLGPHKKAT
ncbi:hypothetical protein PG988_006787 [Apiospora saccharicola]